jgi:TRAP transporter TAXI family solute receptor
MIEKQEAAMRQKKVLRIMAIIFIGITLIYEMVLTGCKPKEPGKETPKETSKETPKEQPKEEFKMIRWGTSSLGSTGYNLSAKMAEIISKYAKIETNITPVGGTEATVRSIARGDRDFGFGNTHGAYDGYNGVGTFAKEGKQPILLVAMMYQATLTLVAQPAVKKVEDFKGKTVSYRRPPNPLFNAFGDTVLKAYGFNPDKDVKNVTSMELGEIVDALKTGSIDVGMIPGSIPGTTMPELFESKQFNIIDIGKEKTQAISKESPFMIPTVIKAGTFKGQDKDAYTLGFVNVIFCHANLPSKVVYEATKAVFNHLDELAGADPVAKRINAESAIKNPVIPLHPGAVQYYKEAGLLK